MRIPNVFGVDSADGFWERRVSREIQGLSVPTLNRSDGLSYTTWHLVRHLVRGDVRAYHVYELAHFLQRTADDHTFWRIGGNGSPPPWLRPSHSGWRSTGLSAPRIPWFRSCASRYRHPSGAGLICSRSLRCRALEQPNKDELFLHWCLVKGWRERASRLPKQRLLPVRFNPVIVDAHVPAPDWRLRLKRRVFGTWFMARRAFHHVRTLAPVMWNGFRWRRALAK